MKLDRDKVLFHAANIILLPDPEYDDERVDLPQIDEFINCDVYMIGAYLYSMIGAVRLTEYGLRHFLTRKEFGNTVIISLLINANIQGVSEHPLWWRDESGVLHPV